MSLGKDYMADNAFELNQGRDKEKEIDLSYSAKSSLILKLLRSIPPREAVATCHSYLGNDYIEATNKLVHLRAKLKIAIEALESVEGFDGSDDNLIANAIKQIGKVDK